MCDELLRCFGRRPVKVEWFWPHGEPIPPPWLLAHTNMAHTHTHTLKHPSQSPVTRSVLGSPRLKQATYCRSSCKLISCTEPLPSAAPRSNEEAASRGTSPPPFIQYSCQQIPRGDIRLCRPPPSLRRWA